MDKILNSNWKSLAKPSVIEYESCGPNHQKAIISPLEPGYGHTLGNALRRVLLHSLYGSAITSVKIRGVDHELSSIEGVQEDVVNILLNIKQLVVSLESSKKKKLYLEAEGPKIVRASDISEDSEVQIVNPDAVICTLAEGAKISMEMICQVGRGYVLAKDLVHSEEEDNHQDGYLHLDVFYSPVRQVSYTIRDFRVGKMTNYDQLILLVETNGCISPQIAIAIAARILQDQFSVFVSFQDDDEKSERQEDSLPFSKHLLKKVNDMELSIRSQNCLRNDNIVYIGDLVIKTEVQMLKTPNFGRKSLNEIKAMLEAFNLKFGMDIPDWPPQDLAKLAKKYEDLY